VLSGSHRSNGLLLPQNYNHAPFGQWQWQCNIESSPAIPDKSTNNRASGDEFDSANQLISISTKRRRTNGPVGNLQTQIRQATCLIIY